MTSPGGSHSSVTVSSSSTRAAVRFTNVGAAQRWLAFATGRREIFQLLKYSQIAIRVERGTQWKCASVATTRLYVDFNYFFFLSS